MVMKSQWRASRSEVVAEHGMVTAKDPVAAEVGVEVLRQGGNAVDAAVATGFTLCVVEPMMASVGGCGYMLVHTASGQQAVIDYGLRAPLKARPDMYRVLDRPSTGLSIYEVEDEENVTGYRSITVPGTVAGLCLAHRLFGRLPLQQVLEPAIHYAEEGFEVNWYFCLLVGNAMEEMERFPATREVFVPTGFPPKHAPKPADRIVQKELGRLLRRIAAEGPSAFYEGEVAAAVEEDMARNGGLLTREDMARYQAVVRVPTRVAYRGYDVLAAPGSNGCLTLLQTLRILEHLDLRGMGHNSRQYLHAFIEAARHAFADRYRFVGDPEAVDVPMKGLLSEEYSRQIAKLIRRDRASSALEEEPWTYFLGQELHDPWAFEGKPRPRHAFAPSAHATDTDCTTHFNVADAEGNVVSCTQTAVSLFGSKVMTPGTGILWGNGMVWFNPKAGFANSIAPWKRPLVNMAPVLVLRGGRPYLALGSPGGRRIINCNTQVLLNILEFGMGVQEAIAQPRVDTSTRVTFVDSRLDEREMQGLIDMGHQAQAVTEGPAASNFATPLGILIDPATGLKHGGADVFRIAEVCGW